MNLLQLEEENGISSQLDIEKSLEQVIIGIRTIKRTGRKFLTIIEGLEQVKNEEFIKINGWKEAKGKTNLEKLCYIIRTITAGGGAIKTDKSTSLKVIQLQGNHKDVVRELLLGYKLTEEENIKLFG